MSKYENRVAKLSGLAVLALFAIGTTQADALLIWNGTSPAANDSTSWVGLGPDQTLLGATFSATSTAGNTISGSFTGNHGLVAVVGTSWPAGPGFNSGDTLVWTFDNSVTVNAGTAPLKLGFKTAVLAAGLEIQSDAPGAFTAQVTAFDGATSLGTENLASANGDPIFIGAQDSTADITSVVFDLTACTGTCDLNDFAVDTLRSINPSISQTPEPASLLLLASGLIGMGFKLRRRVRSGIAARAIGLP